MIVGYITWHEYSVVLDMGTQWVTGMIVGYIT